MHFKTSPPVVPKPQFLFVRHGRMFRHKNGSDFADGGQFAILYEDGSTAIYNRGSIWHPWPRIEANVVDRETMINHARQGFWKQLTIAEALALL